MEHRISLKRNARWYLGAIFAGVGGGFVVLGAFFLAVLLNKDLWQMGTVYLAVGSMFFVIGMVLVLVESKKRREAEQLVAAGRCVWGEVADFVPDRFVRINHKNPYFVIVKYTDVRGRQQHFKSWSLRIDRMPSLIGRKVRIYISGESSGRYYVDVAGILEEVNAF